MTLFNILLSIVATASAFTSQNLTPRDCEIIPPALPSQIEICYTKLAKQTGLIAHCDSIPTNEGIGRCKGYLLALTLPWWSYFVNSMGLYYVVAILLITLIITTERKEFLLGICITAVVSTVLILPNSTYKLPLLQQLLNALETPVSIVKTSSPLWFKSIGAQWQTVLVLTLSFGQIVGHFIGATRKHVYSAVALFAVLFVLSTYGTVMYTAVESYFAS